MLLVCRDCVPPITAARACKATRTTLFSGCWAVRVEPRGLGVEAQHPGFWVLALKATAHDLRPHAARGPELGHLFQEVVVGVEEEGELGGKFIHDPARVDGRLHVGDPVCQGEGNFLHGGGSGLADVVA